jgi:flagellar motor switch/type III secretory pathway protein FliN
MVSAKGSQAGEILKQLKDAELELSILLAEDMISIGELAGIGPGSILKFNKGISDPVHLSVGKKKIACGSVVQSGAYFGIKVSSVY